MEIRVVNGVGEGHTELSAFDAALKGSGVYNYNLLYLSSVIPSGATVKEVGTLYDMEGAIGDRLYVVMAEERGHRPGETIGAGIGWYQFGLEGGFFVEHHTKGDSPVEVRERLEYLIEYSIRDLCAFRDKPFQKEKLHHNLSITTIQNKPACAMVLAVFEHETWNT
ncbi:MAG: pyruvoyl-dependent arginine decarboxylase [Candidatus Magasanikbacteria bacterium CG10_big_fil_rev_8_21_14_0_10_43_6]|uniref:Pyruvoyl-dependent arginine decarboxylase AaxB n=1 Tax=Candidatus Magasanikbacteria bacterium CG10_big_fil_rev_8_21_14_0_10_43_6 TaxID=1974650 RepID=A0A2M6W1Y5_9BACT|nr:MAG: pyruvoyl-dependent arginine decarboxylase [Candidatus Magasanikbacteria bacterium CG10_big_fil_rev_8_21_14_0_10_43_6]